MTASKYAARVMIIAFICALTTSWLGWISLPIVGFIYALIDRRAVARGTVAALGAALGWLVILGADAARGASVRAVASRMGDVMQLPAVGFVLATFLFAAALAGTAAVIASAIMRNTTTG